MNARRLHQHERLADCLREASGAAGHGHVRRRVFLVGCPRSGTTLLQLLLHAHRQVRSMPETHFLPLLLGSEEHRRSLADRPRSPAARVRRWRRSLLTEFAMVASWRAAGAWSSLRALGLPVAAPAGTGWLLAAQMAAFVRTLDAHALAIHKPVWLEKTPDHLFYIDHLRQGVPDARFIHLQRDGRQVVASLHRAAKTHSSWRPFLSLEKCVDRWATAVAESARWRDDPRHLHVRYEDLAGRPRETLARVLAFLGCEQDDTLWSRYRAMAASLILPDEPWKANNLGPLQARDGFTEVLDAAQRRWVDAALAARAEAVPPAPAPFALHARRRPSPG